MAMGHEKLDVYRVSIRYTAWVLRASVKLKGDNRHIKDQWLRASQSIPLNIAEGNGIFSHSDRRRFFEIARGSAMECAAIQDILEAMETIEPNVNSQRKLELDRISAMLSKLGGRGYK